MLLRHLLIFCAKYLDDLTCLRSIRAMRLPNSAAEFERVIGRDDTLRLAENVADRWGRIHIPVKPIRDDHPIVRTIGRDAATRLQKEFGGSLMRLPSCKVFKRSREIAKGWMAGYSMRELSQRFSVSERTVYASLNRITSRDVAEPPKRIVPHGTAYRPERETLAERGISVIPKLERIDAGTIHNTTAIREYHTIDDFVSYAAFKKKERFKGTKKKGINWEIMPDWAKSNSELAILFGVARGTVRAMRRKYAPETINTCASKNAEPHPPGIGSSSPTPMRVKRGTA